MTTHLCTKDAIDEMRVEGKAGTAKVKAGGGLKGQNPSETHSKRYALMRRCTAASKRQNGGVVDQVLKR